jgi:hypothetical protein
MQPLDPPLTPQQIAAAELRAKKEGYIHRNLVEFDHLCAGLIDLPPDQTLSSAIEIESRRAGVLAALAKALNWGLDEIQRSHGQLAQAGDIARAENVEVIDSAALASEAKPAPAPGTSAATWKISGPPPEQPK